MTMTKEEHGKLLDCLLEMGDLLLDSGAEISRVEDTLSRMGRAYGASRMNVFVITSIISTTMEFPDGEAITETRRIYSNGRTDFYRLEKLNALSRRCCAEPLSLEELRANLSKIASGHQPFPTLLLGSIVGAGAYSVFFGGSIWDGVAAGVSAVLICLLQQWLNRTQLNTVAFNLLISLLAGLMVGLVTRLIPALHTDMVLIGDIMLLIPGLAMTNAIRNIMVGNTISGVVRLAESLFWAAALAGGFMVSMVVFEVLG